MKTLRCFRSRRSRTFTTGSNRRVESETTFRGIITCFLSSSAAGPRLSMPIRIRFFLVQVRSSSDPMKKSRGWPATHDPKPVA